MKSNLLLIVLVNYLNLFTQNVQPDTFTVADGHKIKPSVRKYLQYTEQTNGLIRFQSILTREIKKTIVKDKEQILIIQKYAMDRSIDTDSSYCDAKTLLPIAYYSNIESEEHEEVVIFTEDSIKNTTYFGDSTTKLIKENKKLYNGVVMDDLISTMPLKKNTKFLIQLVNPGMRYAEYYKTIEVEGQDNLEISGIGSIKCWKIKTTSKSGSTATEWFSVDGQVQVKKIFRFKNGDIFYRVLLV